MKLYVLLCALVATANGSSSSSSTTITAAATTPAGTTATTSAGICVQSIDSSSNILHTFAPIEIDCPTQGGKPAVALIAFNMGGAPGVSHYGEDAGTAVQISMAASVKGGGGTSGLVVHLAKISSAIGPFDLLGKYNNGDCSGALNAVNKACAAIPLYGPPDDFNTKYLSVSNTGGCTAGSKLIIEASIREFNAGQNAKCTSSLVQVGLPRSTDPDVLYCNVGTASTCTSNNAYDEVPCGKISAGNKCVRSATKVATTKISIFSSSCTSGSLSCEAKDFVCPDQATVTGDIAGPCLTCNSNDCFSKEVLTAADSGDASKIAIAILGFAIAVNFIFA